jgi:hypothetical protein
MAVREFETADGRRWRVWSVHPQLTPGDRRGRSDRRVTPVENVLDPPVLERRRGRDRRAGGESPAPLGRGALPAPWSTGWLVLEVRAPAAPGAPEVRRVAPIPVGWETCAEAELVARFERAEERRRPAR